jgi:hypothetical protein
VRLEGLGKLKNPPHPGFEPTTFRLVAQCPISKSVIVKVKYPSLTTFILNQCSLRLEDVCTIFLKGRHHMKKSRDRWLESIKMGFKDIGYDIRHRTQFSSRL